jgi:hypothetical protein
VLEERGYGKFIFREEGQKLIIQGQHVIYILHSNEAKIWKLCDGSRKVRDIIEFFVKKYKEYSKKEISREIIEFIRTLKNKGLVE